MPTALVVDDSKVDQRLVEVILRRIPGLNVLVAANGRAAMELVDQHAPDLILTDMLMPEMGGIELVEAIRRGHPTVPIIAMTAHGSEDAAAEALRKGATSYIPKRHLSRDLPDIVEHVLGIAGMRTGETVATQWLTQTDHQFVIEHNPAQTEGLIRYLGCEFSRLGLFDATEIMHVGIAVSEALCNAINHGNLGVGSDLRETDMTAYRALLAARRETSPYRERKIYLSAAISRVKAVIVIRDEGAGFDPSALVDPTDADHLEKVSGRGMLLIRTFMDEVRHNKEGNEITMVRSHRVASGNA